jgi:hypothetical protein
MLMHTAFCTRQIARRLALGTLPNGSDPSSPGESGPSSVSMVSRNGSVDCADKSDPTATMDAFGGVAGYSLGAGFLCGDDRESAVGGMDASA